MDTLGKPILAFKNTELLIYDEIVSDKQLEEFRKSSEAYLENTDQTHQASIFYKPETLNLYEWTPYKIEAIHCDFKKQDFSLIGDYFNSQYGILYFKNTIGKFYFKNTLLTINSSKLSLNDYFDLIETINNYIFNLSYDYNRKGSLSVFRNNKKKTDLSYHIFLLVYHSLITKRLENNLLAQFNLIEHNPLRKFTSYNTQKNISQIDEISDDEIIDIFSSNSQYVRCSNPNNKLATKITKNGINYLPLYINTNEDDCSYDTNENQFIKYFLTYILDLFTYFENLFKNDTDFVNYDLLNNTTQLKNKINKILSLSFLRDVSNLSYLNLNSPALQKKEGYRQFFNLYMHLKALPETNLSDNVTELIENKSIDILYENYCYFKMASIISEIYNTPLAGLKFKIIQNDFSKMLEKKSYSNYFEFEKEGFPKIQLHYNKNYTNANKECYSKAYDPDISLEIFNKDSIALIYIFDAKFKLTSFDDESEQKKYFKYDDISKMHTYKDAIVKTVGAFVLYPGTEKKVYNDSRNNKFIYNGVGAFPLSPGNQSNDEKLKEILTKILSQDFTL